MTLKNINNVLFLNLEKDQNKAVKLKDISGVEVFENGTLIHLSISPETIWLPCPIEQGNLVYKEFENYHFDKVN